MWRQILKSFFFDNLGINARKFIDYFDSAEFLSDLIKIVGEFSLFDIPNIMNDSSKFIYENVSVGNVQNFTKDVSKNLRNLLNMMNQI